MQGGRPPKLEIADVLLLMYGYLRDYTTSLKLGWAESVSEYMPEDFDITKIDKNKYIFLFLSYSG